MEESKTFKLGEPIDVSNVDISNKATPAQIRYATDLIRKLGYERDRYDLESMDKQKLSKLIGQLKWELDGLR